MADKETAKADITFFSPELVGDPESSNPYLKGYRCTNCGQLDFPKLSPCPNCWGEEFEVVKLSTHGKLYSVTDIYIGQAGMATPYIFGYVDLPENLRIFAQLEGEPGSFQCDEDVVLTIGEVRKNKDGLPINSYKFKKPDGNHKFKVWHSVSE